MNSWFRFYHEVLDDPKVQRLDPVTFKHWVNLLCLAARNAGKLPSHSDMAFALRIDEIGLESLLDRLLIASLIEVRKGGPNGSYIAPHGWDKRQYKSDSSTCRVKRFRERSKTVSETPPDTDTDTDTEQNISPKGDSASGDALTLPELIEGWNELAEACGLPKVVKLNEARTRAAKARLREFPDLKDWQTVFANLRSATWMHGDNDRGWRADFNFILQPKSFLKLLENSYGREQA